MTKKLYPYVAALIVCSCSFLSKPELKKDQPDFSIPHSRVMFWNVENLFDIYDDSLTNDDEFTPYGIRAWSYPRYKQKINNIYKVFMAAGNPDPPEIIALCEVENYRVLYDLSVISPFGKCGYKILHQDSKDMRGIDVAVLYDPKKVRLLDKSFIPPEFRSGERTSRDIVFMKAEIRGRDTVNLFFCHWPSKYGGAGYTEPLRRDVASHLRRLADSLLVLDNEAFIIIGGDLNDPPTAESINRVLNAKCFEFNDSIQKNELYNVSCTNRPGTYKHQGIWETIDQFIVSGNLLQSGLKEGKARVKFEIFNPEFLLVPDEKFSGTKPFRTWEGMRYTGGYSDHLPIILNFY